MLRLELQTSLDLDFARCIEEAAVVGGGVRAKSNPRRRVWQEGQSTGVCAAGREAICIVVDVRRTEVLMVGDVVHIGVQLQVVVLTDGELFLQAKVVHDSTRCLIGVETNGRHVKNTRSAVPGSAVESCAGVVSCVDLSRVRQSVLYLECVVYTPTTRQLL